MMNNSLRVFFVICFLAFDAAVIWYCLLKGNPNDALQAWSNTAAWTTAVLVGAGIGIMSVSDSVIQYLSRKP
jgi:hypothetical protein